MFNVSVLSQNYTKFDLAATAGQAMRAVSKSALSSALAARAAVCRACRLTDVKTRRGVHQQ